MPSTPLRLLAIDVGAGTQDILIYESGQPIENCAKLVLPSPTRIVAARIHRATERGRPVYLAGNLMGGGPSTEAIRAHLNAGLPVYAAPEPARTVHNDLDHVRSLGIAICETPPVGAEIIRLGDIDLAAISATLRAFEVEPPMRYAVAIQDHGYQPGVDSHALRYAFLRSLLRNGGDVLDMAFLEPPPFMLRMQAVQRALPGAVIMDTGAAAVLGVLADPVVARAVADGGAIVVNIGNMHTFGVAVRGRRIYGLFEHHTGGISSELLGELVERLRGGRLTHDEVLRLGGHGAAFNPRYGLDGDFALVAITGPNRERARGLGYYEAVPHGDMMLAGPYGLVEATLGLLRGRD